MARRSGALYAFWLPVPGMALIGLGFSSKGKRKNKKKMLGLVLLGVMLVSLIVLPGCGTNSNGGGGGGGGVTLSGGTPAGDYTVTITGTDANGVVQADAAPTVTVTVN
jgi:hypothetical protein